jgi:hypothetical protein
LPIVLAGSVAMSLFMGTTTAGCCGWFMVTVPC